MNCEYSRNVPIYNEYSSLNSILMASLYSENSRDMIIKKAKSWDRSNKYKSLIKKIVNKNKQKSDISNEISLLNPDEIFIENMFFLKDPQNKKTFGQDLKKNSLNKLSWNDDFIIDFYRGLGLSCLDIYINDNKYYLNLYKFIKWNLTKENYETDLNNSTFRNIDKENIIPENPDVLIVFNNTLNSSIIDKYIQPLSKIFKKINLIDQFLPTDDKFNFFQDIKEEVSINDNVYILDSVLLRIGDKSIVGFRCDGEKYVYNNFSSSDDNPCSVIKFDWSYNEGIFCYNPIKCQLEDENINDINDYCFDFNKGDKTLIYIKKDKIEDIIDVPDSEILKIIQRIKAMDMTTITDEIKQFDPTIIEKRLRQNELEKILLKYDMKLYMSTLKTEIKETATEIPA
jgi:hypothetical protein